MAPVVDVENLSKSFVVAKFSPGRILHPFSPRPRQVALADVAFEVKAGQILGVVGPNGAGKTTLLRILADLLTPDKGRVTMLGRDVGRNGNDLRRQVGYVSSDERSFFWRLSGRQNLMFFGRLYGLSAAEARKRIAREMDAFDLRPKADHLFRDYSTGIRKKFSVIRALLHRPSVLLLDELTSSLDPESNRMVKRLVRAYVSHTPNCAALWSTHRLEEIVEICDRVLVIDRGKITFLGDVTKFNDERPERSSYVLRTRDLNGGQEAFCRNCPGAMNVKSSKTGGISEFVFGDITSDEFGKIVTMAVKDYGAYVIFAGCLKKNGDNNGER